MTNLSLQLEEIKLCPICNSPNRQVLYQGLTDTYLGISPNHWHLHRCNNCGTVYLDPRPNQATIGAIYGSSYYTHQFNIKPPKGLRLVFLNLRNGWLNRALNYCFSPAWNLGYYLFNLLPKPILAHWIHHSRGLIPPTLNQNRWLDIGCGNGEFLSRIQTAGWLVEGIEPDQQAAAIAQQLGVNVQNVSIENAQLLPNTYDIISLNHVIEHLHNPLGVLQICFNALKPNGRLWIATPNLNSLGHHLYQRYWLPLDIPRHLILFNKNSLQLAVEKIGFTNIEYLPRGFHISPVFAQSEAAKKGNIPTVKIIPTFLQRLKWLPQEMRHAIVRHDAEELILNAYKPQI